MTQKTTTSEYIKVVQIASPIGRKYTQEQNLVGLGLNKIGRARILKNSPEILGMIKKVSHLVRIEVQ
ncbi:MAG: 50S ribosomal protein L30 [Rickettsiaceae bacterium]|nr:50S ribosomal protein L30 [Rickettsiaceae bacterium]